MLLSMNLYAQSPALNDFNQYYKSGQYSKALSALEQLDSSNNVHGEKGYYEGLCYSKLQEYDKAIKAFEVAIKANNSSPDLQYEYGQALYAANELKAARRAFTESAKQSFNTPASLYYIAHISQILEEFETAKNGYSDLLKNKEADIKIKQIARFQMAETMLSIMKEKISDKKSLTKGVEKYVLPNMKQAYESDKSTNAANDILQRMAEIEKEYDLDPNLLKNGRRISPKRYSGYFSQKIKFDDNITLTNEENNIQQSKKESFVFESEVYGKYDIVLQKRFIMSPELRINFVQNGDQDTPEVFQNDTYSVFANLKNKYEHNMFGQPSSFLFDIEYNNSHKDWRQIHERSAYATSLAFAIGESFTYFSVGDTSVHFKRKAYKGENEQINNTTYSLSADQTAALPNGHMVIGLFEADFIDNYNNTSTSTDTYLLRFDYLIPEIMPKYTLDIALASTVTDTKEQEATRGTEFTLNPSLDLSKEINDHMKISINYDYTKNNSKQSDYKYSKSIFSTEFRYSF